MQIFLSYVLYECIILETAHHKTTFRIFATLLKRLHLKNIAAKCSIFLCQLYFVLWEGQGCFFCQIWFKFRLDRQKKGVQGGYGGEAQNQGYFCKIPIIKQDTNFTSQTFGWRNF